MGKLLNKTGKSKTSLTKNTNNPKTTETDLYKPIEKFAWKDASRAEIHKNSIQAYRKFAF
jgi:hypothetical protein